MLLCAGVAVIKIWTAPEDKGFTAIGSDSTSLVGFSRRLAADGGEPVKFSEGTCTQHCSPYGGDASLAGLVSGQCDCSFTAPDTNASLTATCAHTVTCCGRTDTAGGVILYFAITLYTFLAVAIVCDDFFCESLAVISERLKLSDDVAGATFMAAGSSAPELFTAIVATLISGSSEGMGTVIGSAIFNIMIITGCSCVFAGQVLQIWWYPLCRDSITYIISIVTMICILWDGKVYWHEALVLLVLYCGYIFLMVINAKLQKWALAIDAKGRWPLLRPPANKVASAGATPTNKPQAQRRNSRCAPNPMLSPEFRPTMNGDTAKARALARKKLQQSVDTVMKVGCSSNTH